MDRRKGIPLRLVIVSDTHSLHRHVLIPDGDVIIHCGDMTKRGNWEDLEYFAEWFLPLPHKHKLLISGNHDYCWEDDRSRSETILRGAIYLQDSAAEIEGKLFYGSPFTPVFYDWAFNLRRGKPLADKWKLIPKNTDVLITHGPPFGVLDVNHSGEHAGCDDLLIAVNRVKPKLHAFGHLHESYGARKVKSTLFVNACACNLGYSPRNPAVVVDLDKSAKIVHL